LKFSVPLISFPCEDCWEGSFIIERSSHLRESFIKVVSSTNSWGTEKPSWESLRGLGSCWGPEHLQRQRFEEGKNWALYLWK